MSASGHAPAATRAPHFGVRKVPWHRLYGLLGVVIVLLVWTLIGTVWLTQSKGVATPWAVVQQMGRDGWSFYWPNLRQTLKEAGTGYLFGNALAIASAGLVLLVPALERLITQIAVASYCLPLVAIGPILSIAFTGDTPASALAGLSVYFTTLIAVLLGLRSADPTSLDLVSAYGGGRWQQTYRVRLQASLPSTFAGLKLAAPAAVLGAILGEFMGRTDNGLGITMVVSEQALNISRTWGIALTAGLVACFAYAAVGVIGRMLTPWDEGPATGGGR
jgi:ABC-type nitrate/sulfonate/bicarbonate transport system permease component